jgi:hypothetical protein
MRRQTIVALLKEFVDPAASDFVQLLHDHSLDAISRFHPTSHRQRPALSRRRSRNPQDRSLQRAKLISIRRQEGSDRLLHRIPPIRIPQPMTITRAITENEEELTGEILTITTLIGKQGKSPNRPG